MNPNLFLWLQAISDLIRPLTDSGVEDCNINNTGLVITVECTFSDVSSVLGFQITAQINDMSRVNVLYVNTSMDPQSPVNVVVPSNGEYMVTVLPSRIGVGILDTVVEFSQLIMVDEVMTTSGNTCEY